MSRASKLSRTPFAAALIAALLGTGAAGAQSPPTGPIMRGDGPPPKAEEFSIAKEDPGLDDIVDPNAKLELLYDGFGLTEGPVWVPEGSSGYWLFGGLLDNVIYKITPQKQLSAFMEHAGYSGDDEAHSGTQTRAGRRHVILIGPSCASRDSQGRLIRCADNDRKVMRLEKDGTTRTVLSDGFEGKKYSGPNDIVVRKDDGVYLTDNDFGLRDAGKSPLKELQNGVFLIREGKTIRVLDDKQLGGVPNGIALSPDEKWMYLSSTRQLRRYPVKADGTLGEGEKWIEGEGFGDGIKVDVKGNLFSSNGAGKGRIRIITPGGKILCWLNLPVFGVEPKLLICATNNAFGGPDGKTLFITACDAVYAIKMKTTGLLPGPRH